MHQEQSWIINQLPMLALADIAGCSEDVWYPQPAPEDHPWRYMPNQKVGTLQVKNLHHQENLEAMDFGCINALGKCRRVYALMGVVWLLSTKVSICWSFC